MTTKRILIAASAILTLSAATSAYADVTFDQAYVYAYDYSQANEATSSQSSSGYDSDSAYSFTTTPLDAEAYATATAVKQGVVQAAATADEVSTASFSSPSSGAFDFTGATSAIVNVAAGSATAYDEETYGVYEFDVSAPTNFNLSYALTDSSLYNYDDSYYYLYNYTNGTVDESSYDLNNTTGSVSYQLTPGSYYFEAVDYDYQDYVSQSGIGSQTGSHDDSYSFSISGAPEPSTWMLMIVGVGLVGGMLRHGRRETAGLAGA